jgi:diaminopimelate epimerase
MPLPERIEPMDLPLSDGSLTLPVVFFPGIAHIVAPAGGVRRTAAEELLRRWSGLLPADAVGLLLWNEGTSFFDPLVYVKATDTAVWERGCASGSAAIAAWLTAQRGQDQCLSLKQPGGTIAAVTRWQDRLTALTISGTVKLGEEKTADVVF